MMVNVYDSSMIDVAIKVLVLVCDISSDKCETNEQNQNENKMRNFYKVKTMERMCTEKEQEI